MSARFIVGDVRDVLATIEDDSVDLLLTRSFADDVKRVAS